MVKLLRTLRNLLESFFNLVSLGFVSIANFFLDVRSDIFYLLIGRWMGWGLYIIAILFTLLATTVGRKGG